MIDANQIADALRKPRPTAQQRAIIEAPLEPALVIAGAGSGKTETMADRVLWLLANGHVGVGDVLGLTFTRKAAGELAGRIRGHIAQLAAAKLIPDDFDEFDPPVVATYNSFANAIYRDNAILLGRESDGAVLGEASAWQMARTIVLGSTDVRLPALDKSVDAITKAVLSLDHELSENVASADDVRAMAERFAELADLPAGGRGVYPDAVALAGTVGALDVLLDLAQQFAQAKADRGFVEYADQVSLALEVVRRIPKVRSELRNRFRVVLLDEYQDTSVVQTWLLAELFAGHPVMAVGDPNQSIYGWRGASAANLDQFSRQFAGAADDVRRFALTTSWRNGHRILAVANAFVSSLRPHTGVIVDDLVAGPTASDNPVDVVFGQTLPEEAEAVARWLKQRVNAQKATGSQPAQQPSAAILFRARKTQSAFIEALRAEGVPYHVLGIGGLLAEPEIADLVSALHVVNDPSAGSELIRLLAGSRWRLGVRDLHALGRVASWLRDRDYAQRPLDDEVKAKLRASVAEGEGGSVVDALDFVAHAPRGHAALADFSDVGLERLRDAGRVFSRLRSRAGLDLVDFVTVVEQEFMLDIEVIANDSRSPGTASMEAFFDALHGYLAVSEQAGLSGFLGWLRVAEWRDDLAPRPEDPEPGTVQLLTIHGSKGLEWDHVVVPRWVTDELPAKPRDTNGWLTFGALPYEFRGDAAELPRFDWHEPSTRKELLAERDAFKEKIKEHHELEERRLAYVAVTRARHSLLLTGSFWASQTNARPPSPFLAALASAGLVGALPDCSEFDENPLGANANLITWPLDPLGTRRASVERAAALVQGAQPDAAGAWQHDVDLLLEERRRRLRASEPVALPSRVPASRFKDFVNDPASVAASLRRPMPQKPYRATRLGTRFHSWVENRFGGAGVAPVIDAFASELDADDAEVDEEQLERLTAIFERSPWASRKPIEVEREIHLPFAGRIVVCKIDAVFEESGRYQVVDWKTGKAPTDADDLEQKQLQLALYRLAYSRWSGVDPGQIDAVFYYVADDRVITPTRVFDEEELLTLWQKATAGDPTS